MESCIGESSIHGSYNRNNINSRRDACVRTYRYLCFVIVDDGVSGASMFSGARVLRYFGIAVKYYSMITSSFIIIYLFYKSNFQQIVTYLESDSKDPKFFLTCRDGIYCILNIIILIKYNY